MISHGVDDMANDFAKAFWTEDEKVKTGLMDTYYGGKFPQWAGYMEKQLKLNNEGKTWFVGDNPTLADFKVYVALHEISSNRKEKEVLKEFPCLTGLMERISSLPNIAKWIKERPQTNY